MPCIWFLHEGPLLPVGVNGSQMCKACGTVGKEWA